MNEMKNSSVEGRRIASDEGILHRTFHTMKTNPMIWTAGLAIAGAVSFAAKSHHLGTIIIASIGVLWMWHDMIDEAATAAHDVGLTLPPDTAPLLALHR